MLPLNRALRILYYRKRTLLLYVIIIILSLVAFVEKRLHQRAQQSAHARIVARQRYSEEHIGNLVQVLKQLLIRI